MNILKRVHRVMLPLGRYVSGMGLFGSVKRAEIYKFSTRFDLRLILPVSGQSSAHDARSAVASHASLVLAVFGGGNVSKVAKPIVVNDAVDVVNIPLRPDPVDVEPCKPVFPVLLTKQAYVAVALGLLNKTRAASRLGQLVSRYQARKHPRLGVVVQKLFQSLLGKGIFGVSHVIAPHQRCVGQGLGGVGSTLMPRSIIGGAA